MCTCVDPIVALYNLLVVNMRHRIVCGIACGIHHEVSAVDLATLTEAEYIRHPPRSGAAHLCCGTCLQVADGFKGQLLSYALMASAGHLVLLRRLFPDLDGLHDAMLREVDTYISGPNFATKHGASDYRVDRTTLQLTGPCRVSYEHGAGEWQTDYHFLTWFHHCDAY